MPDGHTFNNLIQIIPDSRHPECPVFADHGDSGSVAVDDQGRVLGLLFSAIPPVNGRGVSPGRTTSGR